MLNAEPAKRAAAAETAAADESKSDGKKKTKRKKVKKVRVCSVCGEAKPGLLECPVCTELGLPRTLYCGEECQRADWKEHKVAHKRARQEKAAKDQGRPASLAAAEVGPAVVQEPAEQADGTDGSDGTDGTDGQTD